MFLDAEIGCGQQSIKQECIPVGCVPPACCPYLPACTVPGEGTWPGECTWSWGVYLVLGMYLVPGVPGLGRCVPGPGGVPAQVLPPPWTEFLTHASENIPLPQTSFAGGNEHKILSCHAQRRTKTRRPFSQRPAARQPKRTNLNRSGGPQVNKFAEEVCSGRMGPLLL